MASASSPSRKRSSMRARSRARASSRSVSKSVVTFASLSPVPWWTYARRWSTQPPGLVALQDRERPADQVLYALTGWLAQRGPQLQVAPPVVVALTGAVMDLLARAH